MKNKENTYKIDFKTPEEAKEYWCPFTGGLLCTKDQHYNCSGNKCMLWVWNQKGIDGFCGLIKH